MNRKINGIISALIPPSPTSMMLARKVHQAAASSENSTVPPNVRIRTMDFAAGLLYAGDLDDGLVEPTEY